MSQSAEAKLQELRGKTNRQLVSLISHKLDRGLTFARTADEEGSDWVKAQTALSDAQAWMALLNCASQIDERRLEFKLAQLRSSLDRARTSQVRMHAAC